MKMLLINNKKGVVLIATYLVFVVLLTTSGAFFSQAIQENSLIQRHNDSLKAFYSSERGIAYAYIESQHAGWSWFTHTWDTNQARAISNNLRRNQALRTKGADADCHFIASGTDAGCYAADDGTFILKTFADPFTEDVTVVRVKGISSQIERVLEYRISREAIFDFAWWTPYNLNLNSVGNNVNGGRIHANGNIYMYNAKRLYGLDTLSAGENQSIYYNWGTYYAPGYYDWYVDGSANINGEVPLPHLDTPRRWAGTTDAEDYGTQHPWKYQDAYGYWRWRSYGSYYADYWPPRDWRNEEHFFYGDSQERNNRLVSGKELNYYNTWIYPAQKDENGDIIFDRHGNILLEPPEQIPAQLQGAMWDWTKYNHYGTFGGAPQQELSKFTVYDPDNPGTPKYVEDTRWKIEGGEVVMTDPTDPAGLTYWAMLQDYNYWKALGYSDADATTWSTHINPEILDGTYGSELPAGERTIEVDNTNSMQQPQAWNSFLRASGLEGIVMANEQGEDMEAPRFASTYKEKSKTAGLYLAKTADAEGNSDYTLRYANGTEVSYTANTCSAYSDYDNPQGYWDCVEKSIDVVVKVLNTNPQNNDPFNENKRPARKVKFINTYTNQTNVALELDLAKMKLAGGFAANGIIYSEVPTRLSNAEQLPYAGDPKKATFNLICEENVYLKGDYNNPGSDVEWMPSAVISKKHIYTLSEDFNDPGYSGFDDGFTDTLSSNLEAVPAFVNYPNYPYVYVTGDGAGNFLEANPDSGGGSWVYYGWYSSGSSQRQQLYNLMTEINVDWRSTFDQRDPAGTATYTVSSSHPLINGQTWGAMPNRVENNHTYNCLLASYYHGYQGWTWLDGERVPKGSIPYGVNLERWVNQRNQTRTKAMNGAYFQLDWSEEDNENRFSAHQSDGPLDYYYYADFDSRPGSRAAGSRYSGPYYLERNPSNPRCYDQRFRNPRLAQNKPIFFGGGESSWQEISLSDF